MRSVIKGPFIESKLLNDIIYKSKKTPIYTKSRSSTIISWCVGRLFFVYNGKSYYKVLVTPDMIGHKFGEFCLTKKRCVFRVKKKKKK